MKKMLALLLSLLALTAFALPAWAAPRPGAVTELYSAEGSYTDSIGNRESYRFHVPQLTADSPAAAEINGEIRERFGKLAEEQFQSMEGGYSLWSWCVEWHAYWHESQLFLLLRADMEGGFTDYAAYGYDFERDCRVDNAMILRQLGVSEEEYLASLREKVQLMFEDKLSSLSSAQKEALGYEQLLQKTLDWADMERTIFYDGTGGVETIVKIASVAGAEWYYHLATPFSYG